MGTIWLVDGFDGYSAAQAPLYGLTSVSSMGAGRVSGQCAVFTNITSYLALGGSDARWTFACAWKISSATSGPTAMFRLYEAGTIHGYLGYNGNGTFSIKNGAGSVLATSADQGIVADTWYHLEFDYNVHDSTGSYELRLDGVAIIGPTGSTDTRNAGTNGTVDTLCIRIDSGTVSIDDFVAIKGGGFIGDCRVITQAPLADGTNTDWDATGVSTLAYQAASSYGVATNTLDVAWPIHAIGDVALLIVEACGGEAISLSTPAGFVEVANSPQATGSTTNGTRLAVFWCRATSAAMTPPRIADAGDHVSAIMLTFRGVAKADNPWDVTGGGVKAVAGTNVTIPGITTTLAGTLVVAIATHDIDTTTGQFSALSNANLSGLTELCDVSTNNGNGGGFVVAAGTKTAAGATGDTTGTVTSSTCAYLHIALRPALTYAGAVDDQYAHNSDQDYLSSATADERATFDFPALGVTGTTKAVVINHVTRKTDAGSRKVGACIRRGSTNYDDAAPTEQSVSYAPRAVIYEADPATDAAWVVANIDAGEFGVVVKS